MAFLFTYVCRSSQKKYDSRKWLEFGTHILIREVDGEKGTYGKTKDFRTDKWAPRRTDERDDSSVTMSVR